MSHTTKTTVMLNHHLHAVVLQNVAIFELVRAFDHTLLRQKFHE